MYVRSFRSALTLLALMTLLLGIVYPLVLTGLAEIAFAREAHGSLIHRDGKVVGSALIGQSFSDPRYFWSRPSATSPQPYNALASSASNLGPLNPALIDQVKSAAKTLHEADPDSRAPIPVELVSASGSGLDPEISPAAAHYQASRVARARKVPLARVEALIAAQERGRLLGFIGEPRVNVLELNLALDAMH